MRCEHSTTTMDEKMELGRVRSLAACLAAILFRARHGKQNVCFVHWLSLIRSHLAWLGSLPTVKIRTLCVFTEYVCLCACMCVYLWERGGGEVEDDRMAILLV